MQAGVLPDQVVVDREIASHASLVVLPNFMTSFVRQRVFLQAFTVTMPTCFVFVVIFNSYFLDPPL